MLADKIYFLSEALSVFQDLHWSMNLFINWEDCKLSPQVFGTYIL